MDHYLIIVSRERPDLFQELSRRHGYEGKVILDRRRVPRPAIRGRGLEDTQIWDAELEREGFTVVPVRYRVGHGRRSSLACRGKPGA